MSDYLIFTDASIDLDPAEANNPKLKIIPMDIVYGMDPVSYSPRDPEYSNQDFYEGLKKGDLPSTAMVNEAVFKEAFRPYLEEGKDILYTGLSSGLSGTFEQSLKAVEALKQDFPERKIVSVDSLSGSTSLAIIVKRSLNRMEAGVSLEENAKAIGEESMAIANYCMVEDLNHLYRGGRLAKTSAIIGSALKLKPIVAFNYEGTLGVLSKERGFNRVAKSMVKRISELDKEPDYIFISHGGSPDVAKDLADRIRAELSQANIRLMELSPVIGCHTGPGSISISMEAPRLEK